MSSATTATTRPIIYLGLDVHKESITIAMLPATLLNHRNSRRRVSPNNILFRNDELARINRRWRNSVAENL
jgi:hypothetical protein